MQLCVPAEEKKKLMSSKFKKWNQLYNQNYLNVVFSLLFLYIFTAPPTHTQTQTYVSFNVSVPLSKLLSFAFFIVWFFLISLTSDEDHSFRRPRSASIFLVLFTCHFCIEKKCFQNVNSCTQLSFGGNSMNHILKTFSWSIYSGSFTAEIFSKCDFGFRLHLSIPFLFVCNNTHR